MNVQKIYNVSLDFIHTCFQPITYKASRKRFWWLFFANLLIIIGGSEIFKEVPLEYQVILLLLLPVIIIEAGCSICQRLHDVGYPWYYGVLLPFWTFVGITLLLVNGLYPYTGVLNSNFFQYSIAWSDPIKFLVWFILAIISFLVFSIALVNLIIVLTRPSNYYIDEAPQKALFRRFFKKFNVKNLLYTYIISILCLGITLGQVMYLNLQIPNNSILNGITITTNNNIIGNATINLEGYTDTSSENAESLQYLSQNLSESTGAVLNIQCFLKDNNTVIVAEVFNSYSSDDINSIKEQMAEYKVAENVFIDPSGSRAVIITDDIIYHIMTDQANITQIVVPNT